MGKCEKSDLTADASYEPNWWLLIAFIFWFCSIDSPRGGTYCTTGDQKPNSVHPGNLYSSSHHASQWKTVGVHGCFELVRQMATGHCHYSENISWSVCYLLFPGLAQISPWIAKSITLIVSSTPTEYSQDFSWKILQPIFQSLLISQVPDETMQPAYGKPHVLLMHLETMRDHTSCPSSKANMLISLVSHGMSSPISA